MCNVWYLSIFRISSYLARCYGNHVRMHAQATKRQKEMIAGFDGVKAETSVALQSQRADSAPDRMKVFTAGGRHFLLCAQYARFCCFSPSLTFLHDESSTVKQSPSKT